MTSAGKLFRQEGVPSSGHRHTACANLRTSRTSGAWADIDSHEEEAEATKIGGAKAARHLSQAIWSANLVVLSGLGTSLCVRRGEVTLAPTMRQLRDRVREKFDELDAVSRLDEATGRVVKREGTLRPLLVYPRSTKYAMAFSQPYVDMMSACKTACNDGPLLEWAHSKRGPSLEAI